MTSVQSTNSINSAKQTIKSTSISSSVDIKTSGKDGGVARKRTTLNSSTVFVAMIALS